MAGVNCGKLDLTKLPQDEIITINKQTWLKADVDEKIYIIQNKPHVVIKFSDACIATVCDDQNDLNPALANQAGMREANDGDAPSEGCDTEYLNCSQNQTRSLSENITNGNTSITQAQSSVDANSINIYSWYGAAVKPASAAIPMKSNIKTYGPYASSNFGSSCGGTQVEVNADLAPWVFGSVAAMNAAGSSIVESTAIGLVKAETGNITVPGLPLSGFSNLGVALGGVGPTLSSINFTYGSGGITTSYEFSTYTPKFGGLNRHLIDRIKNISKNRTEQLRFLRSNQITRNKISRKLKNVNNAPRNNKAGGGTLQRVMVGEIYNWESVNDKFTQCTIVGLDPLGNSVGEMTYNYNKKAYISLDAIYGPVSQHGDGGLPRYASFETTCHLASPDLPQPPYAKDENPGSEESDPLVSGLNQYNLAINQDYMDPLTNPFGENEHHHAGPGIGHVIDLVGRENQIPEDGMVTNFYNLDDENRYSEDYRFLGMRGPIVLHSWGYDTQGKPIPNAADTEEDTKTGQFKTSDLKDKFLGDWLGKPATWPVAPIDFRFDRKRGVWVTPPGYKVVVAILDEKLEKYGTAQASLINKDTENNLEFGDTLYDKEGNKVKATEEKETEAKIKVADRLGLSYPSGTKMYCYYDTFKCEYIILEALVSPSIRFRLIDLCENIPVEPDYGDVWTKHAGYGDKFPNNHILGIRITCEGDPVNNKGEPINNEDIADPEKHKDIFINLFDTCGQFGSANAYYDVDGGQEAFIKWKLEAATGFGLLCDPSSENTCVLGEQETQCSSLDPDYDSYDIVFLDGYARFIECELTQKLYMSEEEAAQQFPNDEYKKMDPEGNAAATIQHYYGDAGNGVSPKFYKKEIDLINGDRLVEIEFRVFDPFFGENEEKNPFRHLKENDKVLCVFNENLKKYIIYNSLLDKVNEVVKFALVEDKNPTQLQTTAILVDEAGRPVKKDGKTRIDNQNDFNNNTIIVKDPHMAPPGPGELTCFGPALGSANLNEHINGIELTDGYQNNYKMIGPFIGYALKHQTSVDPQAGSGVEADTIYEIITLEHFAKYVTGKVGTVTNSFNGYYLGGRAGHRQGVIPVGRGHGNLPNNLNVIIRQNLQDFIGRHTFMIGDKVDNPANADNVINDIDGCGFIASLDNEVSTTTNLVYDIIECETSALTCSYHIKNQEYGNLLNKGDDVKFDDTAYIEGQFLHGFMWDPVRSKNHYDKTVLENCGVDRNDHKTAEIIVGCRGMGQLTGITNGGNLIYTIVTKTEIANVAQRYLSVSDPGLFGCPDFSDEDARKIGNSDDFWDGLEPTAIQENDKPKITMSDDQQWMTYDQAIITASWDEYGSRLDGFDGAIESCKYKIVYAQEAPVIMTCIAASKFTPKNLKVNLSNAMPSCQGVDREPVSSILQGNVFNPMGHGAEIGDFVTIQRVFVGSDMSVIEAGHPKCNYKYIVIGTGKPPE